MADEAILSVRSIDKSFGGLRVLSDVSLEVRRGSISGLIGPNGSGKSTLFDIITCYQPCDDGEILFNGDPLRGLMPFEVSRRGLIRTFQLTRVFPTLTVAENLLAFGPGSRGEQRAREMLDFVGLLALADREASGLSYGQQKLLEIAQVLMLEPTMLLLDEPMAGINPGLAEQLCERLRELRERGMTLLMVEHNVPLMLSLCDTLTVLNGGKVMASDSPDHVLADPAVREAFLGD